MKKLLFLVLFLLVFPILASASMTIHNPTNTTNGYVWWAGDTQPFRWDSEGSSIKIRLRGTSDEDGLYKDISVAGNVPNTGAYSWKVGTTDSGQRVPLGKYSVIICNEQNSCDIVGPLEIASKATITVTEPLNVTVSRNVPISVKWTTEGADPTFQTRATISLMNSTRGSQVIANDISNNGSYTVSSIPSYIPDGEYKIRVCIFPGGPSCSGMGSDGSLIVNPQNTNTSSPVPSSAGISTTSSLTETQRQQMITQLQTQLAQLLQQLIQLLQQQLQQGR